MNEPKPGESFEVQALYWAQRAGAAEHRVFMLEGELSALVARTNAAERLAKARAKPEPVAVPEAAL